MKIRVAPFRVPVIDRFGPVEWVRIQGEDEVRLPEYLRDWDPGTNLRLGARVQIDAAGVFEDTGVPSDADLRLMIGWVSRSTSISGGELGPSISMEATRLAVETVVPGREVGGVLELEVAVVLAEASAPGEFSASRPGSVLWRDTHKLGLEGDHTRFPVAVVDFRDLAGRDSRSAWWFDWDPRDLSLPVMGGMQLYVNLAHEVVAEAITTGTNVDGARFVRDAMKLDIARNMIAAALTNDDFDLDRTYEEDSIGAALQGLIRLAFPKQTLSSLRFRYGGRPAEVEADLQAFLGFLHQPGAS